VFECLGKNVESQNVLRMENRAGAENMLIRTPHNGIGLAFLH
jgi:hypothetical protein